MELSCTFFSLFFNGITTCPEKNDKWNDSFRWDLSPLCIYCISISSRDCLPNSIDWTIQAVCFWKLFLTVCRYTFFVNSNKGQFLLLFLFYFFNSFANDFLDQKCCFRLLILLTMLYSSFSFFGHVNHTVGLSDHGYSKLRLVILIRSL